jgi:hypothetical protein
MHVQVSPDVRDDLPLSIQISTWLYSGKETNVAAGIADAASFMVKNTSSASPP